MEAKARYDFTATANDELSFHKGDTLKIMDPHQEGSDWHTAEFNGREGFIPATYVVMAPHAWYHKNMTREDCQRLLLQQNSNGQYVQPEGAYIVRMSESTAGDFTLSVKFNDSVEHFKILRDGAGKYFLWVVKFNSINQLIDYHRTASVSRTKTIYLHDMVVETTYDKAEALFNFEAKEEGELSFTKGAILYVIEKPDPNWWMVLDNNGSKGLIPATYVKAL